MKMLLLGIDLTDLLAENPYEKFEEVLFTLH